MEIQLAQIVTWLIVGAVAGWLAGTLVTRRRRGFGTVTNLGIGLVGALIGGFLFRVLGIRLGLGHVSVSLEDLAAALIGSLLFLAGVWVARRKGRGRA
jgi:uncharacterized membrane protein YeaQ/YmgE (transglycosylase-associated protein family)